MIILNERNYAETCLKNNDIGDKPLYTINILARYYYHCLGIKASKIPELLIEFLDKAYPAYLYMQSYWIDCADEAAKKAASASAPYEIAGVWVTQSEFDAIGKLQNKVMERLAFTLLCLAKLANMRNPGNPGWVNTERNTIFQLARISGSSYERALRIGKLFDSGLIELSRIPSNQSVRVTFIDNDSEHKLFVNDFRELGYEYMAYLGENFIRCAECGVLTRGNKYGNKRYCSECAAPPTSQTVDVVCVECGEPFAISSKNHQSKRCPHCYDAYRRNRRAEMQRIRREKTL